ncbi:hypothetical protein HHI36_000808 [Cryptolaemus montrouzieri]|uniref:Gag-like protein n=1 Tax=Cryptolaemus montrouzieri TaxID=559131 RepID=A0ABD2P648_9CUCU
MKQNSIQKEKTHAFVLEGLDNEPDVEEIKEEMKATHQICVKQIYKMKNTRRPLYLVITGVKYGDMTPSCNAKPVCLKCAKGHFTLECHLKQEEVPKCVNCGGNHPANNIQCPVYINIVKNKKISGSRVKKPQLNPLIFQPLPPVSTCGKKANMQKKSAVQHTTETSQLKVLSEQSDFAELGKELKTLNSLMDK